MPLVSKVRIPSLARIVDYLGKFDAERLWPILCKFRAEVESALEGRTMIPDDFETSVAKAVGQSCGDVQELVTKRGELYCTYVNLGDPYIYTLTFRIVKGTYYIRLQAWGDIVEANPKLFD